ncbi:restriction endonuclease [Anaerosporobacter sp.]|uniref:restriction endonuclease n=1 Tax=Anaerosporobacter sp. TaxID=1872529 RepID=UPI00286F3C29|nr:restriction endonuclease [Anaerosporobacter sp.]
MSHFIFPRLTDEKQFEHLVADCYRALYPESQVDEYGRRGQKQYGIDITVQMELQQELQLWCIQCKNYETISVSDIDELLSKCTYYMINPFSKLIIATAASNDTKIVDHLIQIRNVHSFPFDLEYLSWERICSFIENNPSVYQKYYSSLQQVNAFKDNFFEIVKQYEIGAFLRIDPMIEGLNINIPANLDICKIELETLLDNYIERNNDVLYLKIGEFMNWLDSYNGNLSVILYPNPNGYDRFVYLPRVNGVDDKRMEIEQMVLEFRKHLTKLMNEIAAYME